MVECNYLDAELLIRAFKKKNIVNEIHHVTNGEDALNFLFDFKNLTTQSNNHRELLIFLNLRLPKISGLELFERMKNMDMLIKTSVVVMSSSANDPEVVKAIELGANGYLTKPINFNDLNVILQGNGYQWLLFLDNENG